MAPNYSTDSNIQSHILGLEYLLLLHKIFNMVSREENYKNYMIAKGNRSGSAAAVVIKRTDKSQ